YGERVERARDRGDEERVERDQGGNEQQRGDDAAPVPGTAAGDPESFRLRERALSLLPAATTPPLHLGRHAGDIGRCPRELWGLDRPAALDPQDEAGGGDRHAPDPHRGGTTQRGA